MSNGNIIVLGCGNSTGVPAIGNYWGKCDPANPKNARTRSSIFIQYKNTSIVVDTGPDFRTQINREDINHLDGAFFTHAHSDHVNGIDELRLIKYRNEKMVPFYSDLETLEDLRHRFPYLFNGWQSNLYPPVLEPHVMDEETFGQPQQFMDLEFIPFAQDHGTVDSVGYRFGDFAYSVDMVDLDDKAVDTLKGVKTWLVDAAGYNYAENKVHAHLQKIYDLNAQIGAEEVYLTSLTLSMDYKTLCEELEEGYKPAYDGMKLSFTV